MYYINPKRYVEVKSTVVFMLFIEGHISNKKFSKHVHRFVAISVLWFISIIKYK